MSPIPAELVADARRIASEIAAASGVNPATIRDEICGAYDRTPDTIVPAGRLWIAIRAVRERHPPTDDPDDIGSWPSSNFDWRPEDAR